MDTEKLENLVEVAKKLTINLESEHAKDVANHVGSKYLWYKFVDDQVSNINLDSCCFCRGICNICWW